MVVTAFRTVNRGMKHLYRQNAIARFRVIAIVLPLETQDQ